MVTAGTVMTASVATLARITSPALTVNGAPFFRNTAVKLASDLVVAVAFTTLLPRVRVTVSAWPTFEPQPVTRGEPGRTWSAATCCDRVNVSPR
jgi:hypothetical protein